MIEQLDRIPRLTIFNKSDLLSEEERSGILGGHDDAALASALDRGTIAPILALIAEHLRERWEAAALVPTLQAAD